MVFICKSTSALVGKTVFQPSPIFFQSGAMGVITSLYSSRTLSYRFEKSAGQRRKTIPNECPFLFNSRIALATSSRYFGSSGQVVTSSPE